MSFNSALASALMLDVLDYGGGNMGSLLRALKRLNLPYRLCGGEANGVFPSFKVPMVLPGVGAFGSLMQSLHTRGLAAALTEGLAKQVPYLGICVGLQVLFEGSQESPDVPGLAVLPGQVVRFTQGKIPQIGWNGVECNPSNPVVLATTSNDPVPEEAPKEGYVYYVNSYYAQPADDSVVLYHSEYEGQRFCGAVQTGCITAFQFHPEKSDTFGHQLIQQWALNNGCYVVE